MKIDGNVNFITPDNNIPVKTEVDIIPNDIEFISVQEKNLMPVSEKAVIDAIEKANKIMINHSTRAEFAVHKQTKAITVKIIDTDSNQVIKEFPPEKVLDMIAKMMDMAGLIVDERR